MEVFLGTICAFGFNYAPYQWAQCQGQLLPISQFSALFSLLGTQFGGNGQSNFGLPNLQNNAAIGQGGNYTVGQTGGQASVSLSHLNLPAHTHGLVVALSSDARSQSTNEPVNAFPAPSSVSSVHLYAAAPTAGKQMGGNVAISLAQTGGTQPVAIASPYQVSNYCIALYGIFPPRQ